MVLVSNMESLDGKRVVEMSYLILYDYVRKSMSALGKRMQCLLLSRPGTSLIFNEIYLKCSTYELFFLSNSNSEWSISYLI